MSECTPYLETSIYSLFFDDAMSHKEGAVSKDRGGAWSNTLTYAKKSRDSTKTLIKPLDMTFKILRCESLLCQLHHGTVTSAFISNFSHFRRGRIFDFKFENAVLEWNDLLS
jgi:hypothetical protein